MTYRGTIRNGVVELEGGNGLPDGTLVKVEPVENHDADPGASPAPSPLFGIGRRAVRTGQPDLATNIDHHLYGHPKVRDGDR